MYWICNVDILYGYLWIYKNILLWSGYLRWYLVNIFTPRYPEIWVDMSLPCMGLPSTRPGPPRSCHALDRVAVPSVYRAEHAIVLSERVVFGGVFQVVELLAPRVVLPAAALGLTGRPCRRGRRRPDGPGDSVTVTVTWSVPGGRDGPAARVHWQG